MHNATFFSKIQYSDIFNHVLADTDNSKAIFKPSLIEIQHLKNHLQYKLELSQHQAK